MLRLKSMGLHRTANGLNVLLKDEQGTELELSTGVLKEAIRDGRIEVTNLILRSDGSFKSVPDKNPLGIKVGYVEINRTVISVADCRRSLSFKRVKNLSVGMAKYASLGVEVEQVFPDVAVVSNGADAIILTSEYPQIVHAERLFEYTSFEEIDLRGVDTSSAVNMNAMFHGCKRLVKLDLSEFDTSNVVDMCNMFSECIHLTELDLSSFSTSKVKWMNSMFSTCKSLSRLNVSSFDTSNVRSMQAMFVSCSCLAELDLRSFRTASDTVDLIWMFHCCNPTVRVLDKRIVQKAADSGLLIDNRLN